MKLGADRFYRKPIDPRAFLEDIRELLDGDREGSGAGRGRRFRANENEILKLYNERLVNKLEDEDAGPGEGDRRAEADEKTPPGLPPEKEVLLQEIHHRVKNNMQVISSLFNLQVKHTGNEECRGILVEGRGAHPLHEPRP